MRKLFYTLLIIQCCAWNMAAAAIDTVQYSYQKLAKSSKPIITSEKDTIISTFEISYPEFKDPALNELLKILVLGDRYEETDPDPYNSMAEGFLNEADEMNAEEIDFPRAWYRNFNIGVKKQIPATQTLSFSISDENYTGGAHPLGNLFFINYDFKNRNIIKLTDLVQDIMMARLNYIAETIFRKQEGLSPSQALDNYFFEGGRFKLNNNFLIEKNGLTFWYNPYEVRSYAEGPLELVIPYSEIKNLLIPNNPYTPKLP